MKENNIKKKKNYCNKNELYDEILISFKENKLTNRAFELLYLMAYESSKKLSFTNEDDRYDCILTAVEDLLKYWRNFDVNKKDSIFSYYTQIIKNAFVKCIYKLYPLRNMHQISISNENLYNIE